MPPAFRLPFAIAAGCAAIVALSVPAFGIAEAPAQGPQALQALLTRYDKEPAGVTKDKLAAEIDSVAHQKYASASRLFWYVDLDAAKAAARIVKKPILHLRMLGRLDEELSCANSRLFRTTLYANKDVSAYLRDHFILYWSSERPVPKITIDYGDGRKLERTITGNSAHYVMDADGHVLDVLPGVYAPKAFIKELGESVALAGLVRGAPEAKRAKLVADYHQAIVKSPNAVLYGVELEVTMRSVGKGAMEVPMQRVIVPETVKTTWSDDALEGRAKRARLLYGITGKTRVLDDASVALINRLYDAQPATAEQRSAMLGRLERSVLADTALNQQELRPRISAELVRLSGNVDFDTLNAFVYANVFATPKQDAWLGLLPRTDFTGLPGDGVVMH